MDDSGKILALYQKHNTHLDNEDCDHDYHVLTKLSN